MADVILVAFGRAVFTVPKGFDEFSFTIYGPLTVIGVIAATLAWGMVVHRSRRPIRLFSRLAVIVSAVLLIPDFLLLGKPGNPTGPVIILMAMHVAIGITTYGLLTRVAAMSHPATSIAPDKSM